MDFGKTFLKGLLISIIFVFASQGFAQTLRSTQPESVPGLIGDGETYTLGKEDVVNVLVRNQPEFSGAFVIGPDGDIQGKPLPRFYLQPSQG